MINSLKQQLETKLSPMCVTEVKQLIRDKTNPLKEAIRNNQGDQDEQNKDFKDEFESVHEDFKKVLERMD